MEQAGGFLAGVHAFLLFDWADLVVLPTGLGVLAHAADTEPSLPGYHHPLVSSHPGKLRTASGII